MVPVLAALWLAACASAPRGPESAPPAILPPAAATDAGIVVLQAARSAIGAPYRYGGSTPQGFDCSGLAQYAYREAGIAIPRTAAAQQRASTRVAREALQPGDLVFFATGRDGIDHVGVYAGAGRFVHAPSSGRVVSFAYLDDPWYASRYAGAGRFRPDGVSRATARATP